MDVTHQVAIETARVLPSGTYQTLTVRACTTDLIYLQIWTLIAGGQYQLKWQIPFSATVQQTNQISTIVSLSIYLCVH